MADAGEVLAGKFGRELLGVTQTLFLVFIMASHILTFVIAMNTLTEHGTCSIVFGVVGAVVSFVLSLPRTLAKMSWLSLVCKGPSIVHSTENTNKQQHSSVFCPLLSSP